MQTQPKVLEQWAWLHVLEQTGGVGNRKLKFGSPDITDALLDGCEQSFNP